MQEHIRQLERTIANYYSPTVTGRVLDFTIDLSGIVVSCEKGWMTLYFVKSSAHWNPLCEYDNGGPDDNDY